MDHNWTLVIRRVLARVLDLFTILFLTFALSVSVLVTVMRSITSTLDVGPWGRTLGPVVVFAIVAWLYETAFVALRGQTPGKDVLHVRVVDIDTGAPPGWRAAAWRSFLVGVWRFVPGVGVGTAAVVVLGATAPFGESPRGVHDRLARTRVEYHDADLVEPTLTTEELLSDRAALEARYGPRSWWGVVMKQRLS